MSPTSCLLLLAVCVAVGSAQQALQPNIYAYQAYDIDGNLVSMEKYRGKVVYMVNVASNCALTEANYMGMRNLHNKYRRYGFEIAAFPSNQFANQEPGTNQQIKAFAQGRYGAEYDLYAKVDVNGPGASPLWQYLKAKVPGITQQFITWNFAKFLVDRNGVPVKRYQPFITPEQIESDIVNLLNQPAAPVPQRQAQLLTNIITQRQQQQQQQQSRQQLFFLQSRNGRMRYTGSQG